VPFLLIATVFGALSGYIGGILGAVKDTKIFAKSTSVGAIVNIILNIILVGRIGVIGAAIATVISYFVTWVIRFISVKKYIRMNIRIFRDSIAYFILFIQSILLYSVQDIIIFFILETLFFMMILIIHHSTLHNIYIKLQKSRREK
jgi:O-antigen/teichoic acid export membrane protein